jgi:hypothetical protein
MRQRLRSAAPRLGEAYPTAVVPPAVKVGAVAAVMSMVK